MDSVIKPVYEENVCGASATSWTNGNVNVGIAIRRVKTANHRQENVRDLALVHRINPPLLPTWFSSVVHLLVDEEVCGGQLTVSDA